MKITNEIRFVMVNAFAPFNKKTKTKEKQGIDPSLMKLQCNFLFLDYTVVSRYYAIIAGADLGFFQGGAKKKKFALTQWKLCRPPWLGDEENFCNFNP